MSNWEGKDWNIDIPEIYQIELSSACNLHCKRCIREDKRVKRSEGFFNVDLLSKMISRGDFEESYFVELQMYGEPLLNPKLGEFIDLLHSINMKVGLSTNGTLMYKCFATLLKLDYLTISLDSAWVKTYEDLRGKGNFDLVVGSTNELLNLIKVNNLSKPKIDIQAINFVNGKDELPELIEMWKGENVVCRSIYDCFALYQDRKPIRQPIDSGLCLNPWMSVSVQWDGDVVPCNFGAGKGIVYGNLNDKSLEDIWRDSVVRKLLQYDMRMNLAINREPCKYCYFRSPVLFHQKMLMQELKK